MANRISRESYFFRGTTSYFIQSILFLGFQNSLNEVSVVQLKVSCPGAPGSKTDTVAEGQPYKLRAEVLKYDCKICAHHE